MSEQLEIISDRDAIFNLLNQEDGSGRPTAFLTVTSGGVLDFAEAVFPNAKPSEIYAQSNERYEGGRGPHFDVYANFVREDYPWLGLYNLAGHAAVRSAVLPRNLALSYFEMYPEPTDEAYEARRNLSEFVLKAPGTEIFENTIDRYFGIVLPQSKNGPDFIHEITPSDSRNPGKFVKMIVPNNLEGTMDRMISGGYKPLDELLTNALEAAPPSGETRDGSIDLDFSDGEIEDEFEAPSFIQEPRSLPVRRPPYRRHCNLD